MCSGVFVFYFINNLLPLCFAGFFFRNRCGRERSRHGVWITWPRLARHVPPSHQKRSPRDVCPGNEGVRPCLGGASRRIANESAFLKVELQQSWQRLEFIANIKINVRRNRH